MERNDFSPEVLGELSALEQREYMLMMNHPDYLRWPHHIQEAAKRFPPFYLYRLKSTGQIVRITKYNDKKGDLAFPVIFNVLIDPEFNELANAKLRDMSGRVLEIQREIFGVPEADLERVMLRKVARQAKVMEAAKAPRTLIPMAARATALRKSQKIRRQHNNQMDDWKKKKEISTSFPIDGIKPPTAS
jgi:hypothetical protein